jgi:uncharacterized protein YabN with tetrapyrrole methylase and pyrophosphatase domain
MEERYEHPNTEKALLEHFEDELEGACEYDKLAEAHPHMAGVYHAIARDELSHADFFRREMKEHGYHLPEELEVRWHNMLKKYGYAV